MTTGHAPAAASLLAELRTGTRALHEALEGRLAIASEDVSERDCVRYFAAMLGLVEPLDAMLWQAAKWPADVEAETRAAKARWLCADLERAGYDAVAIANLPRCDALPPMQTLGERLGVAYVLEGSTLGGRVLARRPGFGGWRFFAGYEERTGPLWRALCEELERHAHDEAVRNDAVRAAQATFALFTRWFAAREVLREPSRAD